MAKRWKLHFWDHWQSLKEIWFRRTCTETTIFIHENKWVLKCPYEFWVLKLKDHAPINVKQAGGGGGGRQGMGVGIWRFSKICSQIPCARANHSSQGQTNFPTPSCTLRRQISEGWTQEKHKKISPNNTLKSLFILRCCITKDTFSCYSSNHTF